MSQPTGRDRDTLTGVLDRRMLLRLLSDTRADRPRHSALMVLDIDHLASVNDHHGQAVGDDVIRALVALIGAVLPDDAVLGRLAGDEFAAVLFGRDLTATIAIAEHVCDVVSATPFVTHDHRLQLSVSVGVATFDHTDEPGRVLAHAHEALQRARRDDDNSVRGHDDERAAASDHNTVHRRVARALHEGHFALLAQPIVDLRNDQVTAHEVLLRLRDGGTPDLAPRDFLPSAERSTLAAHIDRWVIGRAVAVLASPRARRQHLRLQVNLSARTLDEHEFADEMLGVLNDAGVDPHRLGVEIAEAAAVRDVPGLHVLAKTLAAAGCPVVLDDFGSGLGALRCLQDMPYAAVKIAGPLVRDADRTSRHRAVVEGIVRVARGLSMQVIAEEIDREPLLDAVRDAGVRAAQGYLLGKPRPLDELLAAD